MTDVKKFGRRTVRGFPHLRGALEGHRPLFQEAEDIMLPASSKHIQPEPELDRDERIEFWNTYLDARVGTYEFRCRRYDAVIERLRSLGMRMGDTILDVGAGRMEFAKRLRERDHRGMYVPVDGCIDGTDLNHWEPQDHVDWVVAIEVIEHVKDPARLCHAMWVGARYGVVVTTPNPAVVDVVALDPTHISPVSKLNLLDWGFDSEALPLFTQEDDTLVGWKGRRA